MEFGRGVCSFYARCGGGREGFGVVPDQALL